MLEQRYAVYSQPLAQQLADVAGKLADEYWNDHQQELLYIVDGSFLEEYDELNIGLQFKSAVTVSMTYALMSRCGLEPEHYFDHEDFMAIFDFNTPGNRCRSEDGSEPIKPAGTASDRYYHSKRRPGKI